MMYCGQGYMCCPDCAKRPYERLECEMADNKTLRACTDGLQPATQEAFDAFKRELTRVERLDDTFNLN
jgi:hypothetical protein